MVSDVAVGSFRPGPAGVGSAPEELFGETHTVSRQTHRSEYALPYPA